MSKHIIHTLCALGTISLFGCDATTAPNGSSNTLVGTWRVQATETTRTDTLHLGTKDTILTSTSKSWQELSYSSAGVATLDFYGVLSIGSTKDTSIIRFTGNWSQKGDSLTESMGTRLDYQSGAGWTSSLGKPSTSTLTRLVTLKGDSIYLPTEIAKGKSVLQGWKRVSGQTYGTASNVKNPLLGQWTSFDENNNSYSWNFQANGEATEEIWTKPDPLSTDSSAVRFVGNWSVEGSDTLYLNFKNVKRFDYTVATGWSAGEPQKDEAPILLEGPPAVLSLTTPAEDGEPARTIHYSRNR